jgi:hypothetical protein
MGNAAASPEGLDAPRVRWRRAPRTTVTYPNCDILKGDISGDGIRDFGDIGPLVALLSGRWRCLARQCR